MFKCISFTRCNKHVEAIDKRHQNLTSFPDDIIRYYRTLEELLLDSNQLHELPKGFYKLTQLRKLDISDNEIEKISPEIGNFVNLAEFDCNRNGKPYWQDIFKAFGCFFFHSCLLKWQISRSYPTVYDIVVIYKYWTLAIIRFNRCPMDSHSCGRSPNSR